VDLEVGSAVVMRAADILGGDTLATFRGFGGDHHERLELVRDGRLLRSAFT
jgi:hypothetical protein